MSLLKEKQITVIDNVATGRALRTLRTSRGITLSEIARRMSIAPCYLSDLERGNRGWNQDLCARFTKAVKEGV